MSSIPLAGKREREALPRAHGPVQRAALAEMLADDGVECVHGAGGADGGERLVTGAGDVVDHDWVQCGWRVWD